MNKKILIIPLIGLIACTVSCGNDDTDNGYVSIATNTWYEEDGTPYVFNMRTETYDKYGNMVISTVNYYEDGEIDYDYGTKTICTYDGNRLLHTDGYGYNEDGTSYLNSVYDYSYNTDGLKTAQDFYLYNADGSGYLYSRWNYIYNLSGNIIKEENDKFNSDGTQKWKTSYITEYTYDSNNHIIEEKGSGYNSDGTYNIASAYTYLKTNYTYNDNGDMLSFTKYEYNSEGAIFYSFTHTEVYTYDNNHNVLTYTKYNYTDETTKYKYNTIEYTYDDNNRVLSRTYYYYNADGSIKYSSCSKELYEYDKHGNKISEKELAFDSDDGTISLDCETVYKYDKKNRIISEVLTQYDENGDVDWEGCYSETIKYKNR